MASVALLATAPARAADWTLGGSNEPVLRPPADVPQVKPMPIPQGALPDAPPPAPPAGAGNPAQAVAPQAVPPAGRAQEGGYSSTREAFKAGMRGYNAGDKEAAVKALSYAAEQGHAIANWKLGRMYAMGDGVPADKLKAFEYFSRIADENADETPGSPSSLFVANAFVALGSYFLEGIPNTYVKPNPVRSREMFHYAASYFGDSDAQYNLARLHIEGIGGPKDMRQAARWLNLAADKGHPAAQALLGHLLVTGNGVPKQVARGLILLGQAQQSADLKRDAWITEMYAQAQATASATEREAAANYLNLQMKRRQ